MSAIPDWVSMGKRSYMMATEGSFHRGKESETVSIGHYCSIAGGVVFLVGSGHNFEAITTFPFDGTLNTSHPVDRCYRSSDCITIGNDVWIGINTLFLGGAKVGDGAVIGAGSVVDGEIPPYAIAVGNRAKPVSYRFSPRVIEALLRIQWWNWPEGEIQKHLDLFYGSPEAFVEKFDET